jgi:methionyl-tRNA formyltransferase
MKEKKVVFMGTPYFACKVLEKLIENTNVIAVITQPDKEVGRKKILTSSLVKELAIDNNIKVFTPKKISECVNEINGLGADIYITAAYGQMLPEELINYPEFKTINVHGSLLPKLRGGAPIQRSIMNGDLKTGVTIMQTDKGMDSGDIILKEELIIGSDYDYSILNEKLADLGSSLLIDVLPSIFDKSAIYNKQDEKEVTFAPLIKTNI